MKTVIAHFVLLIMLVADLSGQNSRPQEPKAPFEYNSEDIVFDNIIDNIQLAGTFTFPKSGDDFPSVILISGSGAQDRNSELLGHKSFLVIADYLTKNGIAVLRVDDRGAGVSEGEYNETGLDGFVQDTKSALEYLLSRNEIDKSKIGLIGHSLGGVIAPIIASESEDISFIIMLAGSGIRGDSLMLLQKEYIERKMSLPESGIAEGQKNIKGAYDIILNGQGSKAEMQASLKAHFSKVFGAALPAVQLEMISDQLTYPWLVDLIRFDPEESLSKIRCPVLALNGSNDLQVVPKENLGAIRRILEENGNNDAEIFELEGLNHLFQESTTGLLQEYGVIEQTFSPKVLEILSEWILRKTK